MMSREAVELYAKGLESIGHDHLYLARTCFEQALELEKSPEVCSYLAFCRAKTRGSFSEAIALAREAIDSSPENVAMYLNLGRIYLLAGDKESALAVFRRGMQCVDNQEILKELEIHGNRKPTLFPALKRSHPLNKYLGLILSRLGLR